MILRLGAILWSGIEIKKCKKQLYDRPTQGRDRVSATVN